MQTIRIIPRCLVSCENGNPAGFVSTELLSVHCGTHLREFFAVPDLPPIRTLFFALCLQVFATAPANERVLKLTVEPETVRLTGMNRQQQLIVTAHLTMGREQDVTHLAEVATDTSIVTVSDGLVEGRAAGKTSLRLKFMDHSVSVPIQVDDPSAWPAIDFRQDILPLLSKRGCNSGGCHGRQAGQNGFKLSVFGFDPHADYSAIVRDGRGRRVFPGAVDRSLIFTKAVGRTAHGGGRRMEEDSQDAELLRQWLLQGAPWGTGSASIESIEVFPRQKQLTQRDTQQLRVIAQYNDGTFRDVTTAASYKSNEPTLADVRPGGQLLTGTVSGEAAVTISYLGKVDVCRLQIPSRGRTETELPVWFDNRHPIDRFVANKWRQLRLQPSELCDDATFLRRLMIRTCGTLPTPEETRAFLTDRSPRKRAKAVDRALARPEFTDYWTQRWADVLMINSKSIGGTGAHAFHQWLKQQIQHDRPYNEWVHSIIVAEGNSGTSGAVNFYREQRSPENVTRAVSQAFLGIRMDCAQCHHHPFEKWGQEDFYGLAGYFNGMTRQSLAPDRELIFHPGHKSMAIPVIRQDVATRPPGEQAEQLSSDSDPRQQLADWLTSPNNPWFARLVANRIWKNLMGRGLVEPEDDFRETNPPSNPELLDHMAAVLVKENFKLRSLMKYILSSQTFQLSSQTTPSNAADNQAFSHFPVRRLPAPVMLDAVSQVTDVPELFAGHPAGTRAIQLWDNRLPSYFLDTFGRSLRESPCECGSSGEPTMAQALHLLNAPEIERKVQNPAGTAARLAASDLSTDQIIQEIVLMTTGRAPRPKEWQIARRLMQQGRQRGSEDVLWILMNSYDFLFVR